MHKEYYKEYYFNERNHWFFLARNKIILDTIRRFFISNDSSNKILNVGVATGYTSVLLKEFGDVESIEFNPDCYDFVVHNVPEIKVTKGSILELPYKDESFDMVCAFDVIEHVKDDELAIKEMKRVCKQDGFVYVTVPAYMFLWSNHDEINIHERRYCRKYLKYRFQSDGNIVYSTYFNSLLFPVIAFYRLFISGLRQESKNIDDEKEIIGKDLAIGSNFWFLNKMLYYLFSFESLILKSKIKFPIGVSIMLFWKKK